MENEKFQKPKNIIFSEEMFFKVDFPPKFLNFLDLKDVWGLH
jgi:hypothetical protein